tara:strand:+ start:5714 stop:8956 length:3243 start_codon:yes stop_codon:yes gene_type:complete
MFKKITIKFLLLFAIVFILTCDQRQPVELGLVNPSSEVAKLAVQPLQAVNILDESVPTIKQFDISPQDSGNVYIPGAVIHLEILEGPGYLIANEITSDTTLYRALGEFAILPGVEFDPPFSYSDTTKLNLSVEVNETVTVSQNISFIYGSPNSISELDFNPIHVVTILEDSTLYETLFEIAPLDEGGSFVDSILINLDIIKGPGWLENGLIQSDSLNAKGKLFLTPEHEIDPPFSFSDTTLVEVTVDGFEDIKDTIAFIYRPFVDVAELVAYFPGEEIIVSDLNVPETVNFYINALDESGTFVDSVMIGLEVVEGPGFLQNNLIELDSSAALGQFTIIPISETNPPFNFSDTTIVKAWVEGLESVQDSLFFVYTDGGVSSIATDLEILSVSLDSMSVDEVSTITIHLFNDTDGDEVPVENEWIKFESFNALGEPGEDGNAETFGQMSPVFAQTDELGFASSIFSPLNGIGFANLKVTQVSGGDLEAETYIEVIDTSTSSVNMEMIVPSENDLMVKGGGGDESLMIEVEIRNGLGNLANDDYAVIFSVPCPYPIDGPCPVGDGDFSNDITLNGQELSGLAPQIMVNSVAGKASVTMNSGNRPGSVRLNAMLCDLNDYNEDQICDNPLAESEKVAATISTGPPVYGRVVAGWAEADSTGGGIYSLPITAAFWDKWTNPVADSTNVYWFINPEHIAYVDPSSEIGNCGSEEPGQACTTAYYTSGDIFSQGQICAQVYNDNNEPFIACSGGARCEDYNMSSCLSAGDQGIGCEWISSSDNGQDEGECYFKYSEPYCNNFVDQDSCESIDNELESPFNCVWAPGALTAIPEWQVELNDGLGCHYRPIVEGLDQQQFYFDADGDGIDDLFTGEWEAIGEISADDPICNRNDLSAFDYQNYSQECETNPVCSWEFIASEGNSGGTVGSCIYNGGSGYYNPCVDCQIDLIPLSPNTIDYCASNDEPLDFLIRGHLGDAYGDDVHLGTLLLGVYDASEFYFISSEDTTIDEDMGYEFDPPITASATQITDAAGEVYWIIQFPNGNCFNTNPDDPDAFTCQSPYLRAFLLDPLNGESIDLNVNLFKYCQP